MRLPRFLPVAVLLLALPSPARALDAVVTNCSSDADFFAKLDAVRTAGSGSVKFSCGASPAEITLTQTAVITFGPLLIDGGNKITLSGGNARALFLVGQSRSLVLKRLVIANAESGTGAIQVFENARVKATAVTFEDNHSTTSGGALYALTGAKLKIKRCTFNRNSADSSGGSIAAFSANVNVLLSTFGDGLASVFGGAIYANATTTLVRRTQFVMNTATSDGGAIYAERGSLTVRRNAVFSGNVAEDSEGGAIASVSGTVDVRDATFEDNGAGLRGGAIAIEGVHSPDDVGTLVLERATLRGNDAGTSGGAVHGKLSSVTIVNATLYENFAVSGGALLIDQVDGTVTNATFSHNSAVTTGANLHAVNGDASRFELVNSIVEVNPATADSCSGSWSSLGHNVFFGDASCSGIGSDRTGDPKMGTIGPNGGVTETLLPQPGSAAIDAADAALCPADDQRGVARPLGGACDIGSVEQ